MQIEELGTFFRGDYMPHGHCYLWQPHILWTNVVADLMIAVAYFSIPIAIMMFAAKRKDIGYNKVFVLFSLFILCCGITHLFSIVTIWHGVYGLHGIAKAVTALVSLVTAIYVFKLMPSAVEMPTQQQFDGVRDELKVVSAARVNLESQVKDDGVFKFMIEAMPVGAVLIDESFNIILANKTLQTNFGYNTEQLLGHSLRRLFSDDSREYEKFEQALGTVAVDNDINSQSLILQGITQLGNSLPVEVSIVKDHFDGAAMLLVSIKVLTDSRYIENQLLESHQRLERAINATNEGIWEWNIATNEVNYSPQFMRLIGAEKHSEHPEFEHWKSHIHPDYLDLVEDSLQRHFKHAEKYEVEYLGLNEQGEYGWFLTRGNTLFDANNKPRLMSGSLSYIQEKKRIQEELNEKSQFLDAIYNGSSHAIFVIKVLTDAKDNIDFEYAAFNQTSEKRSGVSFSRIQGVPLSKIDDDVIAADIRQHMAQNYLRCVNNKDLVDYIEMLHFNGDEQWFQTSLYPILDAQSEVINIVGVASDITQIKRYEKQLSENQSYLTNIIDNAICGLYVFNFSLKVNTQINQRYTDITGYSMDDLSAIPSLMELFHPDDVPAVLNHIEQIISTQVSDVKALQYRFKHKAGHWVWCYSFDSVLTRDSDGNPVEMLGTFIDITDLKNNADKLSESNEYLERFAYVASHDLQEPLRKITAFSDSLYARFGADLDGDAAYELTRLKDAASRMRILIRDVLSLSRINVDSVTKQELLFSDVLAEVQDNLSYLIEESQVQIILKQDEQVYVDAGLMVQLLQNLLQNSIKFRKKDVTAKIEISINKQKHATKVHISDNGIGMKDKSLEQIFEPFKRLVRRDEYDGSGIGLAICKQIVKVHGGSIHCTSLLGEGTHFIIELPNA